MKRIGMAAVLFAVSSAAHASLWQWSYTGTAFLNTGEQGVLTATYTWDPAQVEVSYNAYHCPPAPSWFPCQTVQAYAEVFGRLTYSGLATGVIDDVPLVYAALPDPLRVLGGTYSFHVGPTLAMLADPHESEFDWTRFGGAWDLSGGDADWSWQKTGVTLLPPDNVLSVTAYPVFESLRAISPISDGSVPEPATLALILAALVGLIVAKRDARHG